MEEGVSWFGGMFTYGGMQRWQLWFDNPNKAAVLLAELSILGLALFFTRWRKTAALGLSMFVVSSFALARTFSRGGIVAWLISSAVLVSWNFCKWRKRSVLAVISICLVFAYATSLGLSHRMAHGLSGEDRSVGNRLVLWSAVPRMMRDAPFGWGIGRSGAAYMDWYQPLCRQERYRTLVNSHLTWMVETGWLGTVVWVTTWFAFFYFGIRLGIAVGRWTSLAEWMCLNVAGVFSSVMESPWLWLIPGGVFLSEIAMMKRDACRWFCRGALFGCPVAISLVAVFGVMVLCLCGGSRVSKNGHAVSYGCARVECWILVDDSVLGGAHYPRVLREAAEASELVTFGMVSNVSVLPENMEILVVCGSADPCGRRGLKKTIWLSPVASSAVCVGDTVVRGEFDDVGAEHEGAEIFEIPGMARYICDWPLTLSSIASAARGVRGPGGK